MHTRHLFKIFIGYPGQPEVESSHFIEQSPGFGHPYLPGTESFIVYQNLYTSEHIQLLTRWRRRV